MDNNPSKGNIEIVDGEESWVYADPETDPFAVLNPQMHFLPHDRDWNQVHPRLFVGGVWYDEKTIVNIVNEGFTDIFDCCREHERFAAKLKILFAKMGISYNHTGTHDDGNSKLNEDWLYQGIPLIAKAVRRADAKVLVHCAVGFNRGPSMGYAALRCLAMTPHEAEHAISSVRFVGLAYKDDVDIILETLKETHHV